MDAVVPNSAALAGGTWIEVTGGHVLVLRPVLSAKELPVLAVWVLLEGDRAVARGGMHCLASCLFLGSDLQGTCGSFRK